MDQVSDIARLTAGRHGMFSNTSVVVALVSGGADSVTLLDLLARGGFGGIGGLSVLHVNHCLRGADSDADEAFVVALCDSLGIEVRCVRYDVRDYAAAMGLNLEDAGRQVRYRFAEAEVDARCDDAGVSRSQGRIAVAHTADDRIETFLARLVSGAGAAGLSSIQPVRERIVRPLIDVRRADILSYLEMQGQGWREDATNVDTRRERSWVRHVLLPLIEKRNPSFELTARRTMTVLGDEDALLQDMADVFVRDLSHADGEALVFDRRALGALSHPMARRTVRTALVRRFPDASRIEFDHVEAVVAGAGEDRFARDLPFGLRAEVEYDTLRISRKDFSESLLAPGLLHCPGSLDLGDAGTMQVIDNPDAMLATGPDRVSVDAGSISWPLVIDGPHEGDRIRPLGLKGTKKVSDLLVDVKVPQRFRRVTPVLRDSERIVWVAGVRLAEECRVTSATRRVVDIVWRRGSQVPTG